jgi:hypothetical protein
MVTFPEISASALMGLTNFLNTNKGMASIKAVVWAYILREQLRLMSRQVRGHVPDKSAGSPIGAVTSAILEPI